MPRLSYFFNPSCWGCLSPRYVGMDDKFRSREANRYLDARSQSCLTEKRARCQIALSKLLQYRYHDVRRAPVRLKKEHEGGQSKEGQKNATAVHHVAEEARHFHPTLFRNSPHHEVGTISDIGVGPHEHRPEADRDQ